MHQILNTPILFDTTLASLLTLAFFAFVAGLIDSVVGGGGLIQLPALLISLPKANLATVFGTNKIAALSGTSIAAIQYAKRVKFDFKLLGTAALMAGLSSFSGAKIVSHIDSNALKPFILFILIAIAIYTFFKKDLGATTTKNLSIKQQLFHVIWLSLIIGFYDGFFGPGTGSFFVLGFVLVLGFEFIKAAAYAKVVNCMANLTALFVFIKDGNFVIHLAILMAIFNMLGNGVGSKLALARGNKFIRIVFLVIVILMIIRYAYDLFSH